LLNSRRRGRIVTTTLLESGHLRCNESLIDFAS
jgi:hypothetical protein